ncbi:MAG: DNA-directed DNA polymerase II small subunit [Candidatus Methanomethylophilaceae archaeon]|nr:DNA-directed DNA polymerase II small subunit [Candidatus Methanomethylophilaceae archaeon]
MGTVMRDEILSVAASKGILFSPDAMEMILSNDRPMEFVNTVFAHLARNTLFVSKQDIMDCIVGDKILHESPKEIKPNNRFTSDLTVVKGTDITGESTSEGKVNDFANYFRARFFTMKRLIEKRNDFGRAMTIENAMLKDREVRIVGMVYERRTTKNGHTMLRVEDESGITGVFISKDSPLSNELFVDDEVIGIVGRPNSKMEMIMAEKIVRPDIPRSHTWEPSDSTSKIAFLSDCHVGSSTFLEPQWERMTKWLRENAVEQGINYLVFPGDVVDGIGVFPDQDKELDIPDIYEQYEKLAEYLKEIPDHIKMVIHPGNHDAARPAEPQPALNSVFTKGFDSNILMLGNPVYLNVEGRTVLTYHGKSIDDWVAAVQYLTYEDPLRVMKEMCIRRHLAPIYGQRNALAPEKKDYMAMEYIPDIFVSGHVHGAGQLQYNGVRLINASTWQSQTEYQRMHNFNPNPAIMPVVDLASGKMEMKDFN